MSASSDESINGTPPNIRSAALMKAADSTMQEVSEEFKLDSPTKGVDNVNMKKICRVCLSQFDLGIPLFEPNETLNNTTAASLIWNCFSIKVQKSEELPSQICNECALNILISHNFKIQLQQSHKLLQTHCAGIDAEATPEEGFRVTKIDDNLYKVKIHNSTDNTDDEANETSDYDSLLQSLRGNDKLKLGNEDILLVVSDETASVKSVCKQKQPKVRINPDVPRNMEEASKWLKLARLSGPPYECKVCNRRYESEYLTFYMHVRLHFAKKIQCPLCPVKYFPYRKKYHMRTHTKEKPYACPNCNKKFTMRNHLNQHLKLRCIVEQESVCKICEQVFGTYRLLHIHLIKEHGMCRHEQNRNDCISCKKENQNKQMCEYCGMLVTRYNRHLNTCKSAPITIKFQLQNATTCDKCGELLFSQYQIKCHMKTHENHAYFTCTTCGKVFLRKQYLKDHMEIHQPGQYACERCDKVFKRRALLKSHRRTHQTIKKHVCSICSKRCGTKDHLNKHLLVHTKIIDHVCSICNKGFTLKGNLKQHLITHTDIKPFACSVCSKTFALKGNLTKHMLLHDKIND